MDKTDKFEGYRAILDRYREENRLRSIPADRDDKARIDLCGNDYLGLADRWREFSTPFLKDADAAFSASASRLLASRQGHHSRLEERLSELYGRPALLFNSGYHANVGTVSALDIPGTVFLTDKLIHASVIDGISMAGAECARWRHNDCAHLRRLLEKHADKAERMIVVAESIYSMDGDVADLRALVDLKKDFPSMILYLDEAHAFGVRGRRGLGLAEELCLVDEVDIIVGTLGKACASQGAFVVTSPLLRDFLVNNARSLIFSTAFPPVNALWTLKMIEEMVGMETERKKLAEMSEEFRNFISRITNQPNPSASQIVPLMTGSAARALEIAAALDRAGIDAPPIRRPTVPPGGERIRFSLNASLSEEQLKCVMSEIERIYGF